MEKVYVVTLYDRDQLENFYDEMNLKGFRLSMKRPLSRSTHYWLTQEQAEELRKDSRVWGVELVDSFSIKRQSVVNNESYVKTGYFYKNGTVYTPDLQWGHLHCAGTSTQRRKGSWGSGSTDEAVEDSVTIFNNGKHVDIVICDDGVSFDCDEWLSPSTSQTRFVKYQWFDELSTIVNSIDDDNETEVTGAITYPSNSTNPDYHGTHVTGTAAGQYYGWAREANIYNLDVFNWGIPNLLIFDYLRAFHKNKPINSTTGRKNPTITNHSWGGIYYMPIKGYDGEDPIYRLDFSDLSSLNYNGVTYDSNNPGPSGWTEVGVEKDFGVRFEVETYPAYSAAVAADVLDAIEDGIIVIGAAGNDNLHMVRPTDPEWNNTISISGVGTIYYNRGAFPNTADSGSINVGNLSNIDDFRRAASSMFGTAVDVFAPGTKILSTFNSSGYQDNKYGGIPNYFYPISGTSMASPQVAGVAACLASNKGRFTNEDVLNYLRENSIENDMTFNAGDGSFADPTCQKNSPNKYLHIQNSRKQSGQIEETKGLRKSSGQTFPRRRFI